MKIVLSRGSGIEITDDKGNSVRVAAYDDSRSGFGPPYLQISAVVGKVVETKPRYTE